MGIRPPNRSSFDSGAIPEPQFGEQSSFTLADTAVWVMILALCALPFFLYQRAPDFPSEDVAYVELAKSLLRSGFYGFNSVPERVQPPGFPALLAIICTLFGCSYSILIRATVVLLALGFLITYELIRREAGRGTAAAACLLLASAPQVFKAASQKLFPSFGYFLTSMLALLVARRLFAAQTRSAKYLYSFLLSLLVGYSILIQSAGLALVGAFLGWLFITSLRDFYTATSRFKLVFPALVLGIVVQFLWMHRGSNPPEWPLPGYPGTYLSQLPLKSGNFPELGMATPGDFVLRAAQNIRERILFSAELFTRHWIHPSLSSVGLAVPCLLIFLGAVSSLAGETGYIAWYFIGYELIYIFWPWSFELRFVLPSLPLLFHFFFRGAANLSRFCREYPRRVGAFYLPVASLLAVHAMKHQRLPGKSYGAQGFISLGFWVLSLFVSIWMIWRNTSPFQLSPSPVWNSLRKKYSVWRISLRPWQWAGAFILGALVVVGIGEELPIARTNLAYSVVKLMQVPDIRAALWIRDHTDSNAVIAARHVSLVHHYADRRVIWFPPLTNPQLLMQGIRQHHIQYVIVIDRDYSYYLPPDEGCFARLNLAYPGVFNLVEDRDQVRVYKVLPDSTLADRR